MIYRWFEKCETKRCLQWTMIVRWKSTTMNVSRAIRYVIIVSILNLSIINLTRLKSFLYILLCWEHNSLSTIEFKRDLEYFVLTKVLILIYRWLLILRAIHSLKVVVVASSSLNDFSYLIEDNDWALLRTFMIEDILQTIESSNVNIDEKNEKQYQILYFEVCLSSSAR